MEGVAFRVFGLHMEPHDAVFDGAGGELVAGFLVEQHQGEFHHLSRFRLHDIGVNAQLDGACDLAVIMGAVEEMLADIGIFFSHGGASAGGVGHMAVVTPHPFAGIGSLLPFQVPQKSALPRKSDFTRLCSGDLVFYRGPYLVLPGLEIQLKLWGTSPL